MARMVPAQQCLMPAHYLVGQRDDGLQIKRELAAPDRILGIVGKGDLKIAQTALQRVVPDIPTPAEPLAGIKRQIGIVIKQVQRLASSG